MAIDRGSILKQIKPHYNFSYGKGVVFNEHLYEFSEDEIIQMSPDTVWKVFKVPNSKNMIIVTFKNSDVPSHLYFENIRVKVREFRPRPLQCFNCYQYGHPSRICTRAKLCNVCSQTFHGECDKPAQCANCKGNHRPSDRECHIFKLEQEAIMYS